jgi:hypothetical protein
MAQRGDLEPLPVDHQRDRAMVDAGWNRADALCRRARNHLLGRPGGGQIDIADRQSHQRIAHRTADHADLLTVLIEDSEDPAERRICKPVLTGNA